MAQCRDNLGRHRRQRVQRTVLFIARYMDSVVNSINVEKGSIGAYAEKMWNLRAQGKRHRSIHGGCNMSTGSDGLQVMPSIKGGPCQRINATRLDVVLLACTEVCSQCCCSSQLSRACVSTMQRAALRVSFRSSQSVFDDRSCTKVINCPASIAIVILDKSGGALGRHTTSHEKSSGVSWQMRRPLFKAAPV